MLFCTEEALSLAPLVGNSANDTTLTRAPLVLLRPFGAGKVLELRGARTLPVPMKQQEVEALLGGVLDGATFGRAVGQLPSIPPIPSGHALVADDNPVNARIVVAMLTRLGWKADVASNGEQAVAAAQAKRYDVVLMDCQMPVMDGFDATRTIRENASTREQFVVALTANAVTGDRERCLAAGMNDYLSKPLRAAELKRVLLASVGSGADQSPREPTTGAREQREI